MRGRELKRDLKERAAAYKPSPAMRGRELKP